MSFARFTSAALIAATLLVAPSAGHAAPLTLTARCALAKQKIAARKFEALLLCDRRSLGDPRSFPVCVAQAMVRFESQFRKVDDSGDCRPTGNGVQIETAVDGFALQLDQLLGLAPVR